MFDIELIAEKIIQSNHLVFFTGAGVSTASGLPDYRGPKGLWTLKEKGLPVERTNKPWYAYQPNASHLAITTLEETGFVKFLISQNVDGLHLKSGFNPDKIVELHGNATKMRCVECGLQYSLSELGWDRTKHGKGFVDGSVHPDQPKCLSCEGRVVSTIVNFGEALSRQRVEDARLHSKQADLFIVVGSSLSVYPAASFPRIAKNNGAEIIIINRGNTQMDKIADIQLDGDSSFILPKICEKVIESTS